MAEKNGAPDTEKISLRVENIWRNAEQRIMTDIIRRIKKTGEITSTADYQINRLIEMGKSREEVEAAIKDALGATWPEMFELYDKAANWEYVRNRDVYEQVNDEFLPPEDNDWLKQVSAAVQKQTQDELQNLAQSYGFSVLMAGKRVFMPFAQYYQKYVDTAIEDVVTGAVDYNTAIRKVVTQMTNSGLRFVDYASGHSSRADVAARRSVLTGLNQLTAQVNEQNAVSLGRSILKCPGILGRVRIIRPGRGRSTAKNSCAVSVGLAASQAYAGLTAGTSTTRLCQASRNGSIRMNGWRSRTGRKHRPGSGRGSS